jgi:hypothetical protein
MTRAHLLVRLICIASLFISFGAAAQHSQNNGSTPKPPVGAPTQGQGGYRAPPPEALAACKSLAAGAACSFNSARGSEAGTCLAPEGKPLACRPKNGPGGGQGPQAQQGGQGNAQKSKPIN